MTADDRAPLRIIEKPVALSLRAEASKFPIGHEIGRERKTPHRFCRCPTPEEKFAVGEQGIGSITKRMNAWLSEGKSAHNIWRHRPFSFSRRPPPDAVLLVARIANRVVARLSIGDLPIALVWVLRYSDVMRKMTKKMAREYVRGYRAVNRFVDQETRKLSAKERLQQHATLMEFALQIGDQRRAADENRTRQRWARLRSPCRG